MNEFFKGIIGDKKRLYMILAAVLGVLLVALSLAGDKNSDKESRSIDSLTEYKQNLESELSELCSSIDGAGRCVVRVSFAEGVKTEYKGTNKVSETPPRVLGITVVSDGGGSAEVRNAITECMTAMFGIGANRVAVLEMR